MSKLITAKEAFALSKHNENIDWHIKRINIAVNKACENHMTCTSLILDPCSHQEAVRVADLLGEVGYHFKWENMFNGTMARFDISWGGS
jgi:hypothetical protein